MASLIECWSLRPVTNISILLKTRLLLFENGNKYYGIGSVWVFRISLGRGCIEQSDISTPFFKHLPPPADGESIHRMATDTIHLQFGDVCKKYITKEHSSNQRRILRDKTDQGEEWGRKEKILKLNLDLYCYMSSRWNLFGMCLVSGIIIMQYSSANIWIRTYLKGLAFSYTCIKKLFIIWLW